MKVKVQGYSQIHSQKNNRDYTIVYVLTDMSADKGFMNEKFIFAGHSDYDLNSQYEPITREILQNGRLISQVTDLKKIS